MSSSEEKFEGVITAYPVESIEKQQQHGGPGLDSEMRAKAEFTKQEFWGDDGKPYLREYRGSGKLEGKKALITGGDSGIGRSVAVLFAREGADVSFTYLPEEESDAKETIALVEQAGRKAHGMAVDLQDEANWTGIVDEHFKVFGKLDVLVPNAARQVMYEDIGDLPVENIKKTINLNLISLMAVAKYAIPKMKRGSSVIFSASVAANMGNPMLLDYSATKGAIVTFTRALAQQVGPKGIRVNCVNPGIIYTPLQPASNPPDNMDSLGKDQGPLRRPAQPIEVATSYVFLAGPDGSFFTGQHLQPDGGMRPEA
ncbi:uncharacterized protein PFL1_06378 [Pseudozyma flocculosa PF-1]|uniref:Related to short-chain alcohol dehydrogenase n=2 Tax=Pseudozyma flocculosa TaxID=84751 RepID=A0A5C3F7G1_9BASI|nr:uncharacterized protein PFL1_06378 [Pseudozyma flocculosa PF-1]EPQ26171.1 hypothetical protein PFL1_06378 [Pseudozyma flocculosa PF-1]SPO40423.1 related to short-chain alcohol dehydrogenase [Pseudozyma flocculosa]